MNKCTCPGAVDITFFGHLPDCQQPEHEERKRRQKYLRSYLANVNRRKKFTTRKGGEQ